MKKISFLAITICFLFFQPAVAQYTADLETNIQWLDDFLAQFQTDPPDPQMQRFESLWELGKSYSEDDSYENYVVQVLLESYVNEIIAFSNISDKPESLVSANRENGDEENPGEMIRRHIDGINAYLFFNSWSKIENPGMIAPPSGNCSVRILQRSIGPWLVDPGGTIHASMMDLIQLEAQASSSGGTFTWQLENEEDIEEPFFASGSRSQIRAYKTPSLWITVRYEITSGAQCEDVVRVHVRSIVEDD
jgi:hypothetical protein